MSDKTYQSAQTRIYIRCQALKRLYLVWIAPIWHIEWRPTTEKLITWSKRAGKQENWEPSRNTPPHAKLSEAFKGNKLGVSYQNETYYSGQ